MTIKTVDVPKTLKGPKGQTLKWLKKATFVDSPPYPRVSPPSGEALRSVLDMSDGELAEALRPVVLSNGHEYIGETATDTVKQLRAKERTYSSRTASYSPLRRMSGETTPTPESGIIGADNRVVRRNNTEYPWSTVTFMPTNSGWGSGTIIGPSTALTCAHIVHNGVNWLPGLTTAPGTDFEDPTPMPFGRFGCGTLAFPQAFMSGAGGDARFDYCVIEFSGCGDFPGHATGYKGLWEAPDNVVTGNRLYLYGHPSDRNQPQIWGNEGNGLLNGSQFINTFMDAWFGDSGAGMYVYDTDGWPYVVGILRGAGGTLGDDTRPNFGRRITRDVFDFIIANTSL